MLLHDALDVLHHHDGVIDHDTDRHHQCEQRDHVGREAEGQHHGKRADERDRHRDDGDERRPQVAEEQENHDRHQHEGLEEGVLDLFDALPHEVRGIVSHLVGDALGEALGGAGHVTPHRVRHADGVGARREENGDDGARTAIEPPSGVGGLRAELDPADVTDAHERAVRIGPYHNALEGTGIDEPPLGLDVELELLVRSHRLGADASRRGLQVLPPDRVDHVVGGETEARQPVGREPHPHAVVQPREQEGVADPGDALDVVQHVDGDIVGQEQAVIGLVRRVDADDLQDGRGLLPDLEALTAHLLGQLGLGQRDPVLDVHRVDVGVGAQGEGDGERVAAVIAARGLHVQHLVRADHLGLDGLGHGLLDHLGAGAGVKRGHLYLRRHDIGKLGHRQGLEPEQPRQGDDGRDDDGEPRTVDESGGDHGSSPAGLSGVSVAVTTMPGRTFGIPSTMTRSPSCRPVVSEALPSKTSPIFTGRT